MKSTLAVLASFAMLVIGLVLVGPAGAQSTTDDPAQLEAGQMVFEANCAGCHGVDGTGSSTGRNLIGVAGEADRAQHVMSVTDGKGFMPAWGPMLSAEEIDAAVSYVRLTFVDEAAAAEEEAALADTGVETFHLAIVAVAMMAAGVMLISVSRRETLAP